ncbi:MAG TPA: hypothetical protein VFV08_05405, partial [Puia sp.]|nr:hypothetical protein [Puia sp.]
NSIDNNFPKDGRRKIVHEEECSRSILMRIENNNSYGYWGWDKIQNLAGGAMFYQIKLVIINCLIN